MALSSRPSVALVALVALVAPPAWGWDKDTPSRILSVINGGQWGDWGDPEFCPGNSFATGFQLKVEPYQGFFRDDSGLNGVRLICDTGRDTVTSSVGPFGDWTRVAKCPPRQHLVSFRLRVEIPQSVWDDSAANSMEGLCSGGTKLEVTNGPKGEWGEWSPPCPSSWGVCGVRTRLEPPQGGDDDTALNDVRLYCCPLQQ